MTSTAEKAKRTLIGIEIPRDELALRIAIACTGVRPPDGTPAKDALRQLDEMSLDSFPMGESFRRAADQAVMFFHECINAARQPS